MKIFKSVAVLSSAVAASFVTTSAFAVEDAAIQAAIQAGQDNVSMVVAGVVAVAALAFGLGMIKSWLSK